MAFPLLSQQHEDALHATRLLAVEERPFQRVTKRLLERDSLLRQIPRQLPSPPPEGENDSAPEPDQPAADSVQIEKFRDEVLLDFAALESSITRIQLIRNSNQRERERYAVEKAKIQATAQAVKENTLLLREQLGEAQKVLELRKGYDELASKILSDRKLKSRDESRADIEALEREIQELEAEGRETEGLWTGRKEGFERVVAEGEALKRVIKGIKEPEQDEQDGEDGEEAGRSRMGTPALEDGRTPRVESGAGTPTGESMGEEEGDRPRNKFLDVEDGVRSSRAASPGRTAGESPQEDVEMGEDATQTSAGTELTQEQPKSSTGLEVKEEQVKEPAEGMTEEMDES